MACDQARDLFADALNLAAVKHQFDVWAYVIMPEHVHVLLFPTSQSYSISGILKSIKQPVSQAYIAWCREDRPEQLEKMRTGLKRPFYRFWQKGGGYDRIFWTPERIRNQIDYMHANPVRKGFVGRPEDWEWSSAGFWICGREGRIRIERRYLPSL